MRAALVLAAVLLLAGCGGDGKTDNVPEGFECVEGHETIPVWGDPEFRCDRYERVAR